MPVEKPQTTFSGGELAPALYAHTDLVKYGSGLRTARNVFIHLQGGVSNRAGLEFLNSHKDGTKRARLISFQFGVAQNYVLEFTENMMRVWVDGGLAIEPAKTITGITLADPCVLTVTAHGYSNGEWVFLDSIGGTTELNNKFYVVASATTNTFELQDIYGNDIDSTAYTAFTSGGNCSRVFEAVHTYQEEELRKIAYTQSADVMTLCQTNHAPADLSRTAHFSWNFTDILFKPNISPPTSLSNTVATGGSVVVKYRVTAVSATTSEESLVATQSTKAITDITQANPAVVTINSHGYANGDRIAIEAIVGMTELNGNRYSISGVTSNTFELFDVDSTGYTAYSSGGTAARLHTQGSSAALTSTNTVTVTWATVTGADKYFIYKEKDGVYGYLGTASGTSFVDDGSILPDFEDGPPISSNPFAGGVNPGAVAYHKQRRVFGGADAKPQTLNGTQIGNYSNMNRSSPTRDDDAFAFTLDSEQVQQIRHLVSLKKLFTFSSGSTWWVKGGSDDSIITPTSVDADEEFVSPAAYVRPLRIGRDVLYVAEGGKDVLYLNYEFSADGLDGEPLTLLSGHLFKRREVVEWAFARKPFSIIWCATDTGELLSMTYNRKQQVYAWARHDTDGFVESVATINENGEDFLYLSVKRIIGGETRRYIERLHSRNYQLIEGAFFVDSGLTLNTWNATAASSIKVSGGTDWTTDEALTMTENAGRSPFTAADVGKIIALRIIDTTGEVTARCQFLVTAFNSSTSLDVTPETIVPEGLQDVYTTEWSYTFNSISGLDHLEGKTVSILADGNVDPQQVVTNGAVLVQAPTSIAHVGLPYASDIETLNLDLTSQGIPNKTKKNGISEVTFQVEESRGLFAGPDADNLEEYIQRENEDYNEPTALKTGKIELAIQPSWTDSARIFARQIDPLPLTILAIIPEVEVSD